MKVKVLHKTVWLSAPGGPQTLNPGDIIDLPAGDTLNAWLGAGIVEPII